LVDLAPFDESVDIVHEARAIVEELRKYDETLADKPRWLVLNKLDMIAPEDRSDKIAQFIKDYGWTGKVYEISAATREGTDVLMLDIQNHIDQVKLDEQRARDEAAQAAKLAEVMAQTQLRAPELKTQLKTANDTAETDDA
jgi:GTP-binding protein